jgi:pyruvate/2-oxoglutarate dehydrogenase complex dihydrolipoamide dehydrogenase (E3) component
MEVRDMQKYDAIIIGTGQAGPPLAARLVDAGMKVAVIERKSFGGTCVNTGCIPTKTLIASAYAAKIGRRATDFGVRLEGELTVDMKAVKARKDAISGQSRTGVESWMKGLKSCTVDVRQMPTASITRRSSSICPTARPSSSAVYSAQSR